MSDPHGYDGFCINEEVYLASLRRTPTETVEHGEEDSPKQREERERDVTPATLEATAQRLRDHAPSHATRQVIADKLDEAARLLRTHSPEESATLSDRDRAIWRAGWKHGHMVGVGGGPSPEDPFPVEHGEDDIVERLRAFRANPEQEKRPDALAWDAMQEIARLRRSAPREVEWQPWETCPKDRRRVLAHFAAGWAETVCRGPDGSWWFFYDGDRLNQGPTHWRPFVGPPIGDEGGQT